MTQEILKKIAHSGNSTSNDALLASDWWRVFSKNLEIVFLKRDEKTLDEIWWLRGLKFEIPNEEISEHCSSFLMNPYERKSKSVYDLTRSLTPHQSSIDFIYSRLEKNDLILKALEEKFYGRFAVELAGLIESIYEDNQSSLIKIIPLLSGFVHALAVKSIGSEACSEEERKKREEEADRRDNRCSPEEVASAFSRLKINYDKIQQIVDETKQERLEIEIKELFRNIKKNTFGKGRLRGIFKSQRDDIAKLRQLLGEANFVPGEIGIDGELIDKLESHYQEDKVPYHIFNVQEQSMKF